MQLSTSVRILLVVSTVMLGGLGSAVGICVSSYQRALDARQQESERLFTMLVARETAAGIYIKQTAAIERKLKIYMDATGGSILAMASYGPDGSFITSVGEKADTFPATAEEALSRGLVMADAVLADGSAAGKVASQWDTTELDVMSFEALKSATIAALLSWVTAALLIFQLVQRWIIAPSSRVAQYAKALAAGDLDDTAVPTAGSGKEFTNTFEAFGVLRGRLIERDRLADEQKVQKVELDRRYGVINDAVSFFSKEVSGIVQRLGSAASELSENAGNLATTASHTSEQSARSAEAAGLSRDHMTSVTDAVCRLTDSIRANIGQVDEASRVSSNAAVEAEATAEKVRDLDVAVQHIGEIIDLITTIAEKTNLLALNATIEAARAGDAGKGFAVVASEVKTLAVQSAKAADEIRSQILALQRETAKVVEGIVRISGAISNSTSVAGELVERGRDQETSVSRIISDIGAAADRADAIVSEIDWVQSSATRTTGASDHLVSASAALFDEARRLQAEFDAFQNRLA